MHKSFLQKTIIWVVVVATLLVVLFSAAFIAKYATHECDDNECPICEMMVECETTLKTLGIAAILMVVAWLIIPRIKQVCIEITRTMSSNSLISQKVRMNN